MNRDDKKTAKYNAIEITLAISFLMLVLFVFKFEYPRN